MEIPNILPTYSGKLAFDGFIIKYENGLISSKDSWAIKSPTGIKSWWLKGVFIVSNLEKADAECDRIFKLMVFK